MGFYSKKYSISWVPVIIMVDHNVTYSGDCEWLISSMRPALAHSSCAGNKGHKEGVVVIGICNTVCH